MGYAIKTSLVGKLAWPPPEKSEWPPYDYETSTLSREKGSLPSSAPIHTDETKDKFYEDFEYAITAVLAADKLIILGDFNARVGQDSASFLGRSTG